MYIYRGICVHFAVFVHYFSLLEDGPVLQVWLGYQQSLRPSQAGLTLNMGMAATAFLEHQPVMDYLMRAVGLRNPRDFARLTPHQLRTASKAITGIKVSPIPCTLSLRLSVSRQPGCIASLQ
jgi:hypothetical protein